MDQIIVITTTFESIEDGDEVARQLASEQLVACSQLSGPITSYYNWNGTLQTSVEFTLTLKTTENLYEHLDLVAVSIAADIVPAMMARSW